MTCMHCRAACRYIGIGTNNRLTFEMWRCGECGTKMIGKKTFQILIADYCAYTTADCFRIAQAEPKPVTRLSLFPNDA